MKIIITGGGTGGHIYPGISLAKALQKKNSENKIIFVGTNRGMEAELVPREGFQLYPIKVKGVQRRMCLENFYAILLFLGSLVSSFKLIRRFQPDLVIGTGGYVSSSVALVSSLMGIPTYLHEQNALPGITNKFLSLTCRKVFISFPGSKDYFYKKNKTVYYGNPVRENIWKGKRERLISQTNLKTKKKTILVFGGSKGAAVINHTFLSCLNKIDETFWNQWQVLMISGKEDYRNIIDRISQGRFSEIVAVLPYSYEIEDAYDIADLVLCRAGATTVAELTAKGLPAILVPYPYATGNHQLYNARFLEQKNAAVVIIEKELSEKKLAEVLSEMIKNEKKRNKIAQNSKMTGKREASDNIIQYIYDDLKNLK